jgi:hypothetical protein
LQPQGVISHDIFDFLSAEVDFYLDQPPEDLLEPASMAKPGEPTGREVKPMEAKSNDPA